VRLRFPGAIVCGLTIAGTSAAAQQVTSLPDATHTTTLTAIVTEQARVTVPANLTLFVTDVTQKTDAAATTVSLANIVLPSDTSEVRVLIKAAARSFVPPAPGSATWTASDVSWNASAWHNGASASGRLTDAEFTTVGVCAADASRCGTDDLIFTLAPRSTVASGAHTLALTWKFEIVSP
jgi:hypothetical protein